MLSASGDVANITGVDTVTGSTGRTDTLTLTSAATAAAGFTIPAGVTGFEKLVLANGTNNVTLNTAIETAGNTNGNFSTITGGTGYDTIAMSNAAGKAAATPGQVINFATVTGIEQFNFGAATQFVNTAGMANGVLFNLNGHTAGTLTLANSTNTITVTNTVGFGNAGASAATTDTLTVTGGTGVDVVNMAGFVGVLTSNAETVNGSAAVDRFTFNGTGQTFNAGNSADVVTGGAGIDNVNLTETTAAADSFTIAAVGNTGTVSGFTASALVPTNGQQINVNGLDKLTGFGNGADTIDITMAAGNFTAAATAIIKNGGTLGAATAGDVALIQGNYNASTGIFTVDTGGTSSLFVYDNDGVNAGGTYEGIVLIGYVDTGAVDTITAAGVFTAN